MINLLAVEGSFHTPEFSHRYMCNRVKINETREQEEIPWKFMISHTKTLLWMELETYLELNSIHSAIFEQNKSKS